MRRACVLLLFLGMFPVTAPSAPVAACTPTPMPRTPFPTLTSQQRDDATTAEIQGIFSRADAVFRARVVSAVPPDNNNSSSERAVVTPLVTWKGVTAASVTLYNIRGNASSSAFTCVPPFYFKPDTEYIVYAFARQDGSFDAGTRSRAVTDADADLAVLGAGTPIGAVSGPALPATGKAREMHLRVWKGFILAVGIVALAGGLLSRRRGMRRG